MVGFSKGLGREWEKTMTMTVFGVQNRGLRAQPGVFRVTDPFGGVPIIVNCSSKGYMMETAMVITICGLAFRVRFIIAEFMNMVIVAVVLLALPELYSFDVLCCSYKTACQTCWDRPTTLSLQRVWGCSLARWGRQ